MARTFLFVAWVLMGSFFGVAAVGLWINDGLGDRHVLLAVFALIFDCFVQVITFTYFTVTGKMIAQAVHLGKLDNGPLEEVRVLKRSVTRCLGTAFLSVVFATATGAAHWSRADQQTMHLLAISILIVVHSGVLYRQYILIARNDAVSQRVFAAYNQLKHDESIAYQRNSPSLPSSSNALQ